MAAFPSVLGQRSILMRKVPHGFHEDGVTKLLNGAGGIIDHIQMLNHDEFTVLYRTSSEARDALRILRDATRNDPDLDTIRLSIATESTNLADYKDFVQELRDSSRTLYVRNINGVITSHNNLRAFFERYGVVTKLPMITQDDKGNFTAYVTFQEVEEADRGLCGDGKEVDGVRIRVTSHRITKPFKMTIANLIPPLEEA